MNSTQGFSEDRLSGSICGVNVSPASTDDNVPSMALRMAELASASPLAETDVMTPSSAYVPRVNDSLTPQRAWLSVRFAVGLLFLRRFTFLAYM